MKTFHAIILAFGIAIAGACVSDGIKYFTKAYVQRTELMATIAGREAEGMIVLPDGK